MCTYNLHIESIESLIQCSGEPVSVVATAPSPRRPPAPRLTVRRGSKGDLRLLQWIASGYNVHDFEKLDGPFHNRMPNVHAEAVLNREMWGNRMTGRLVALHRAREITLRSAPIRSDSQEDDTASIVRLQVDGDAHHGETDAREAVEWVNVNFFSGLLYHEPSEHGHAGYVDLLLPRLPWNGPVEISPNGDGSYFPSSEKINAALDRLQAALALLVKAAGFAAPVELNGRLDVHRRDGSRIRILRRGSTAKLPRCPQDGDIDRLVASPRFSWNVVERIIAEASGVLAPTPAPAPTPIPPPQDRPSFAKRTRSGRTVVEDTGDRNLNRWMCVREAALPILGTVKRGSDLPVEQVEYIINRADEIYVASKLNGGERDRERDRAFRCKLVKLIETFDPEAAGAPSCALYFSIDDLEAAEVLLRSKLARRKLLQLRKTRGLKGPLTYRTMAIILCTITKNCHVACGMYGREDVSVKSLEGMLRWFGITGLNGTFFRVIVETLIDIGLVTIIRNHFAGHVCRRMQVHGKARRLPFIKHVYATEQKLERSRKVHGQQTAQYLGMAGRGCEIIQRYIFKMQGILYQPIPTDTDSLLSDAGYATVLDELEHEFAEKRSAT